MLFFKVVINVLYNNTNFVIGGHKNTGEGGGGGSKEIRSLKLTSTIMEI